MTLIITGLANDAVVQAVDRRLARRQSDGRIDVHAENAVKATTVRCADAWFVMSYTGFAVLGPARRTDRWLVETLHGLGAGSLSVTVLLERLRLHLAIAFSELRAQPLTLVCAGYFRSDPFIALVSNTKGEWGKSLAEMDPAFRVSYMIRDRQPPTSPSLDVFISGDVTAVEKRIQLALHRIRRRYLKETPERRAKMLVQLIRTAADAPGSKTINKDCHSVIVHADGNIESNYHSEHASAVSYYPHSISARGLLRDLEIRGSITTEGQPPADE